MWSHANHKTARRHGDRTWAQPPAQQATSSARRLVALQRAAGNAAVARLLGAGGEEPLAAAGGLVANSSDPVIQRFPIPTRQQLGTATDYTGGKHREGTWASVGKLLDNYAKIPNRGIVEDLRVAALEARKTFDNEKKKEKVGVERATGKIIPELDRLVADCQIQLLLFQIEEQAKLAHSLESVSRTEGRIKQIRRLIPTTVDNSGGQLAATLQQHESAISQVVSEELVRTLKALNYKPEPGRDNFWYPADGDFSYALPHVSWKAHLMAGGISQAIDVVRCAAPVLKQWGVQHKVDTNEQMFTTTGKLVTIYPPKQESDWPGLIEGLELAVGGQLQLPPGELPVGRAGRVGMRHGQITGLTSELLEEMAGSGFTWGGDKVNGHKVARLDPPGAKVVRTRFPSKLVMSPGGVLCFYYPATQTIHPAIFLDGGIRPDPRAEANPYDAPLPLGVTQHRGY